MSNYRMTLIVGGREINIPVLPAKLNVSSAVIIIIQREISRQYEMLMEQRL